MFSQGIKVESTRYSLSLVCLAGNHSCWAAKHLLEERSAADNVRYRSSWVFSAAELTSDLKFVLSGKKVFF